MFLKENITRLDLTNDIPVCSTDYIDKLFNGINSNSCTISEFIDYGINNDYNILSAENAIYILMREYYLDRKTIDLFHCDFVEHVFNNIKAYVENQDCVNEIQSWIDTKRILLNEENLSMWDMWKYSLKEEDIDLLKAFQENYNFSNNLDLNLKSYPTANSIPSIFINSFEPTYSDNKRKGWNNLGNCIKRLYNISKDDFDLCVRCANSISYYLERPGDTDSEFIWQLNRIKELNV